MLNILNKAKAAITSRLNFKKELSNIQIKRLNICKKCPYNSDNKEEKVIRDKVLININKLLNKVFGVSVTEEAICTKCGCQILFKTTQTEEELICPLKKWNNL